MWLVSLPEGSARHSSIICLVVMQSLVPIELIQPYDPYTVTVIVVCRVTVVLSAMRLHTQ